MRELTVIELARVAYSGGPIASDQCADDLDVSFEAANRMLFTSCRTSVRNASVSCVSDMCWRKARSTLSAFGSMPAHAHMIVPLLAKAMTTAWSSVFNGIVASLSKVAGFNESGEDGK